MLRIDKSYDSEGFEFFILPHFSVSYYKGDNNFCVSLAWLMWVIEFWKSKPYFYDNYSDEPVDFW